jgi:MSHA biogenesis protein MshQ
VPASLFAAGGALLNTSGTMPIYNYSTQKTVPTGIRLRATESAADGVTSAGATEGTTEMRSGQVRVVSAYGSELLNLPVNALLQYWSSANGWVASSTDNTTSFTFVISPAGNVVASNYQNNLSSVSISASTSPEFSNGIAGFTLKAPGAGKNGSVDLNINPPSYLGSVTGRATFGVYKGGPVIYIHENF